VKGLTIGGSVAGILLLPVLFLLLFAGSANAACAPITGTVASPVDADKVPQGPIAGYDHDQLVVAATIMNAAEAMKLDTQAQMIGVMVGMGESGLTNLDHGDNATNPDGSTSCSLGVFQQQWCLAGHPWGDKDDVLNVTHAATAFFQHMEAVPGCESLQPSICAHRVQGNADPNYYAKFYAPAVAVVGGLTGEDYTTGGNDDANAQPASTTCTVDGNGNYAQAAGNPPAAWGGYKNGQIPLTALAPIPWTSGPINPTAPWNGTLYLRPDALAALEQLDNAFKQQFGYDIPINDAYRTLSQQEGDASTYGGEAATPGTSVHGLGLAVDFGDQSHSRLAAGSDEFNWLVANAGKYGFKQPSWALKGGAGPYEPWHWEFWGVAKNA